MIIVDQFLDDWPTTEIDGRWVLAKPLNYTRPYSNILTRLQGTWRVFRCTATAVRFVEDIPTKRRKG